MICCFYLGRKILSKPSGTDRKNRLRRVARPTVGRETTKSGSTSIRKVSSTRTPIRTNIVKRDGSVQPFNRTKLTSSITKAGATQEQADLVTNRVASRLVPKTSVTTKTLSSMTTRSLSKVNTTASKSYTSYRDKKIQLLSTTIQPKIQKVSSTSQPVQSGTTSSITPKIGTADATKSPFISPLTKIGTAVRPDVIGTEGTIARAAGTIMPQCDSLVPPDVLNWEPQHSPSRPTIYRDSLLGGNIPAPYAGYVSTKITFYGQFSPYKDYFKAQIGNGGFDTGTTSQPTHMVSRTINFADILSRASAQPVYLEIVSRSDSKIEAKLPDSEVMGPLIVSYGTARTAKQLAEKFIVFGNPVITDVQPRSFICGQQVTIKGKNLKALSGFTPREEISSTTHESRIPAVMLKMWGRGPKDGYREDATEDKWWDLRYGSSLSADERTMIITPMEVEYYRTGHDSLGRPWAEYQDTRPQPTLQGKIKFAVTLSENPSLTEMQTPMNLTYNSSEVIPAPDSLEPLADADDLEVTAIEIYQSGHNTVNYMISTEDIHYMQANILGRGLIGRYLNATLGGQPLDLGGSTSDGSYDRIYIHVPASATTGQVVLTRDDGQTARSPLLHIQHKPRMIGNVPSRIELNRVYELTGYDLTASIPQLEFHFIYHPLTTHSSAAEMNKVRFVLLEHSRNRIRFKVESTDPEFNYIEWLENPANHDGVGIWEGTGGASWPRTDYREHYIAPGIWIEATGPDYEYPVQVWKSDCRLVPPSE